MARKLTPERNGLGWRCRFTDPSGRRKWTVTCDTKADAQREAEAVSLAPRRKAPRGPTLTLGQAIALGRLDLTRAGRADGTLRWFNGQVAVLRRQWSDDLPLDLLDAREIQSFVELRLRSVSPATVRHHLRCLRRLQRLAQRAGWTGKVSTGDVVVPMGVPYRPHVFGWQEALDLVERVRQTIDGGSVAGIVTAHPRGPSGGVAAHHAADLVEFLLRTGLRRAELVRLRAQDVDLKAKCIHVSGKNRPRTVPLGDKALEVVRRILDRHFHGEDPLEVTDALISRTFRSLARRLREPRLHPHALRHTFATELVRRGVPLATVARLLGHAPGSLSVTQRYYSASEPALREAVDLL